MKKRIRDRNKFQINLNIFKILSILLIIIFLLLIPTVVKKLIKITKVECTTQYEDCPQGIVNSLELIVNKDYDISKKHIEEELSKNIQINGFLIQYKIPSTIKIEINLKKTKFAIKNQDTYYLIDKDGIVLSTSTESNLPTLTTDVKYNIGEKISDQNKFSLDLLEKVAFLYSINQAESDGKEMRIRLGNGIIARFPLQGDIDVLIGSLRLIFSRLNESANGIRMEDVTEIDLRFKNTVLR